MFNIIVKKYEHYNHALGKHISSKREYDNEMKKGGFVSFEEGQRLAENCKKTKEYKPSEQCQEIVRTLLDKKDKKIILAHHPKIVEAMKKKGMKFEIPKGLSKEGGFYTEQK